MIQNKKAQLDEINPVAIAFGLVGGIVGVIVTSRVEVPVLWKILTFVACSAACYFLGNKMLGE